MKKNLALAILSVLFIGLSAAVIYFILQKVNRAEFKTKLVQLAKAELQKWEGKQELSATMSQTLANYWKSIGRTVTNSQMQSASFHQTNPWSAAFISFLFLVAGANANFPYSGKHSDYFQVAKHDKNNRKATLRGFRITEYAPQVGDLVVFSRQKGAGYDTVGYFPAHGELVVEVGRNFIKTIGGNVSNKVTESTYVTDSKGFLTGNYADFFMVIQVNIG